MNNQTSTKKLTDIIIKHREFPRILSYTTSGSLTGVNLQFFNAKSGQHSGAAMVVSKTHEEWELMKAEYRFVDTLTAVQLEQYLDIKSKIREIAYDDGVQSMCED